MQVLPLEGQNVAYGCRLAARRLFAWLLPVLQIAVLAIASRAWAAPATAEQARRVARGWLKQDSTPLRTHLGTSVAFADAFADSTGQALYYVVYLQPSGFVIVPADDEVEPIICFSAGGTYDPSPGNPLGALVSRDLPGRLTAVRSQPVGRPVPADRSARQARWRQTGLSRRYSWHYPYGHRIRL